MRFDKASSSARSTGAAASFATFWLRSAIVAALTSARWRASRASVAVSSVRRFRIATVSAGDFQLILERGDPAGQRRIGGRSRPQAGERAFHLGDAGSLNAATTAGSDWRRSRPRRPVRCTCCSVLASRASHRLAALLPGAQCRVDRQVAQQSDHAAADRSADQPADTAGSRRRRLGSRPGARWPPDRWSVPDGGDWRRKRRQSPAVEASSVLMSASILSIRRWPDYHIIADAGRQFHDGRERLDVTAE